MLRKMMMVALVLMVYLGLAGPALSQGIIVEHSDPSWQAEYWNNTTFTGASSLQRADLNITFDWGVGSPAAGVIASDNFAVRWTRYVEVTPGDYRFTATSDDGIRVWVDNNLIIDQWTIHPAQTFTADLAMGTGHHFIKVEYFEATGLAFAQVGWSLKTQPQITQWRGEYYNNVTLSGTPALVRDDSAINFNWGSAAPAAGIVTPDRFSVRWTRTLTLPANTYTFSLTVDDGARLWVNGHLLIDTWMEQAARTYTGSIYLPGTPVIVELQYFENYGLAVAMLSWTAGSVTPVPGGTVIVDDTSAGFVKGGAVSGWRVVPEGYNGSLTWTYNNQVIRPNYNWARWYPQLPADWYEVFVYIPERYSTTAQARYWVAHADGFTLKVVNQSTNGSLWVSLGTYRFSGNGYEYVSLSDVTYEPYRTRLIAFDAVKWEPR